MTCWEELSDCEEVCGGGAPEVPGEEWPEDAEECMECMAGVEAAVEECIADGGDPIECWEANEDCIEACGGAVVDEPGDDDACMECLEAVEAAVALGPRAALLEQLAAVDLDLALVVVGVGDDLAVEEVAARRRLGRRRRRGSCDGGRNAGCARHRRHRGGLER